MTKIKEIFTSIQGEGPFVGYKQLFVRFCGCNLHCAYCDTDFDDVSAKELSVEELLNICQENSDCHSVSLTGGEPLLQTDFIKEFAEKSPLPIYLETNATLPESLSNINKNIEYISADIKLHSATNLKEMWDIHDRFFEIASEKMLFAKVVFDENITDHEIDKICELSAKYNIETVLQPKMNGNKLAVSPDFIVKTLNKCLKKYKKVRVIPQTHKFINVL